MSRSQREALEALLRKGSLDLGGEITEQRVILDELLGSTPIPDDVRTTESELGGVPVVDVRTPGVDDGRVVLYLHGGAYAMGTAANAVGLASEVARRVSGRALSVAYRLAPEDPFPAARDDVVAAYRALVASGAAPGDVAFVGESAGGGLVVAALLALSAAGLPQPASAAVMSPWADLTLSGASITTKAADDPALTADGLRRRAQDYVGRHDPASPEISPIFADLSGLPALLIQVGSHEILLDDAVRLARRAAEFDVPVQLQVWAGVPHVFQGFSATLDEGTAALDAVGAFIRDSWAVAHAATPTPPFR